MGGSKPGWTNIISKVIGVIEGVCMVSQKWCNNYVIRYLDDPSYSDSSYVAPNLKIKVYNTDMPLYMCLYPRPFHLLAYLFEQRTELDNKIIQLQIIKSLLCFTFLKLFFVNMNYSSVKIFIKRHFLRGICNVFGHCPVVVDVMC